MTIRPGGVLVFLAAATLCIAQSERGSITGVVTDASQAAVPNAPVKVVNMGTNAVTSVAATSSGEYSAANGQTPVEVSTPVSIGNTIALPERGATVRVTYGCRPEVPDSRSATQNAQIQTEDARFHRGLNTS